MLNKIKVIGIFLKKEQPENKVDNVNSASQGAEKEADQELSKFEAFEAEEENKEKESSRDP
jgi:hypothetical protein